MANTIIHKVSAVPGKVPLTSDLALGELAVNSTDGLIYMKNGASSILRVGQDLTSVNGDIVPDVDNTRSLGSATKMWKDMWVGPGSLYVNGQKVLEDSSGTIVVSADPDQNLQMKTTGTGDVELLPSGTGTVQVKGTMTILAGKNLTSSDANPISVAVGLAMNGETITGLADPVNAQDAATRAYVLANNTDDAEVRALITGTGSLTYNNTTGEMSFTERTPTEILTDIKTVDGTGSGLDADLLDGLNSDSYLRSDTDDQFNGVLTINPTGAIIWGSTPSTANHLTNKAYVDNAVSSGTVWKEPITDPDFGGIASAEPGSPTVGVGYIAYGGSYPQTWTGSVSISQYDYAYWNGTAWTFIEPLEAGDRLGVCMEHGTPDATLTGGALGFLKNDIVAYQGGNPLLLASWTFPEGRANSTLPSGTTVLCNDQQSGHYGHTYFYNLTDNVWVEIAGPGSINAGNQLSYSGNTLNVDDGAGSGLDADTVDGLHATQFLRSDAADNGTGFVTLYGGLDLQAVGSSLSFEDQKHSINYNDGGGNFNIRVGNTLSQITEDGYGSHQSFNQANGQWLFNVTTASQLVGETPVWQSIMSINPTEVTAYKPIIPGTNNLYNLGGASRKWNTVYATTFSGTSTTAQYADLAENYAGDEAIETGTVVCFGGEQEVTTCTTDADRKVAGVVSTNPAHLMNDGIDAEFPIAVALRGRVPCKVSGSIKKGDMMVSDGNGGARAEEDPKLGSVIGKALEDSEGNAVIEVVVG